MQTLMSTVAKGDWRACGPFGCLGEFLAMRQGEFAPGVHGGAEAMVLADAADAQQTTGTRD